MREYITERLRKRKISVAAIAVKMGVTRQAVYAEMDSDLRLSSLLKIAEASGYQLGCFDPSEKKFYRIAEADLKR